MPTSRISRCCSGSCATAFQNSSGMSLMSSGSPVRITAATRPASRGRAGSGSSYSSTNAALGRVDVLHHHALDPPVRPHELDEAPVGVLGHGQPRHGGQRPVCRVGRVQRTAASSPDAADVCEALGLVLAQVALEQAAVALLVVEDRDHHVLGHEVDPVGRLDDRVVVLDRAGLGLDHALDHVHDVGLVLGRLQVGLLGGEVERAGDDAVELLDARANCCACPSSSWMSFWSDSMISCARTPSGLIELAM